MIKKLITFRMLKKNCAYLSDRCYHERNPGCGPFVKGACSMKNCPIWRRLRFPAPTEPGEE